MILPDLVLDPNPTVLGLSRSVGMLGCLGMRVHMRVSAGQVDRIKLKCGVERREHGTGGPRGRLIAVVWRGIVKGATGAEHIRCWTRCYTLCSRDKSVSVTAWREKPRLDNMRHSRTRGRRGGARGETTVIGILCHLLFDLGRRWLRWTCGVGWCSRWLGFDYLLSLCLGRLLGLCDAVLVLLRRRLVPRFGLESQHGLAEARVSHSRGMAVGDFLRKDRVSCHGIPVDLRWELVSNRAWPYRVKRHSHP